MKFLDCNCFVGTPVHRDIWSPVDAKALVGQMDQAGIAKALVWHIAQLELHPSVGNDLLLRDIEPFKDRLIPRLAIPCPHTDEMGDMDEWFARALSTGVGAMQICQPRGSYLVRPEVVGGIARKLLQHQIPLIYSIERGGNWNELYDLLKAFPELRIIISDLGVWPADRMFRPLLDLYPNVMVEISQYFVPGGVESNVMRYGAGRLLYGSGFPACYHGALMLLTAHAKISEADKAAIAGGNLQRLIEQVRP
ncbi:MAG: amidohydrolase family protein [Phycisphaerales bacterium]|nr:amidohydrolase family protein [Phycisphaerales bacterium]